MALGYIPPISPRDSSTTGQVYFVEKELSEYREESGE